MKTKSTARVILYVSIVILGSLLFIACPQDKDESVSISERINAFIADANNGNYSNMYTHIHPDAAKYDQSKTGDFWTNDFSGSDYSLGTLNISGEIVTTTINGGEYSNDDIRFTMREDGKKVWKILKLEIDPDGGGYDVIVD